MTLVATKAEKISLVVGFLVLLLCIWLIATLFTKHRINDEGFKRVISLQDSMILQERKGRIIQAAYYDSIIAKLMQEANTSISKARSNKQYYETAKEKVAQISRDVDAYSDDALRRAFAEF